MSIFGWIVPTWAKVAAVVAVISAVFFTGWTVRGWKDDAGVVAERNAEIDALKDRAVLDQALQEADAAIMVDVGKHVIQFHDRTITKTIKLTKEVPAYVSPAAVKACIVPRGFIELHNASASNAATAPAVPDAAGGALDADSHVGLDTVGATIATNYGRCNEAIDRANVQWPDAWAKFKAAYDAWLAKAFPKGK